MTKLRVGIVGCGGRSYGHMEAVDAHEGLEVVAGADMDGERLARFRKRYDRKTYADGVELIQKERPDVAAICTREHARYGLTMAALDAGVRGIVLEKPMARTVDEAREMARKAQEKGAILAVCHQMRFSDEFVAARDAIRRGLIGRPYYIRASSFGHLMEQGPHMVDMVLWLAGDPDVDWVMGQVTDVEEGRGTVHPAPAFVVGYVAFKNGVRAVLECGRRFQRAVGLEEVTWLQKRTQVLGTEGMVDAVVGHHCRLMNAKGGGWQTLALGQDGWDRATIQFYAELYDVMTRGGEHRNNGRASLRGFEIVHAIYQSALTRDRAGVPLPEGAGPLEEIMK